MYNVTPNYITQSKEPIQQYSVRGTIGATSFTADNILSGSLSLSNQCSASSDITLGAVYIGQMACTFVDVPITRTQWQNQTITLEIGLKESGAYEWIPFGVYTIAEAEHTRVGVNVKAYDNMSKFDKSLTITSLQASTPLSLLQYICTTVGVTLANADLTGFCNASELFAMQSENDIASYRDLLYWVCQALCAFATINRNGELEVRRFVKASADDTLDYTNRYSDSAFADYATHYTGVSVTISEDGVTKYYGAVPDDGTTINLGANPFLQANAQMARNILAEVQSIDYIPFTTKIIGGAHYDLGDYITQTDGVAGTSSKCLIMAYDYRFGQSYQMQGYGANPRLATAKNKQDKQIQALLNKANAESVAYVEYTNASQVVIGSTKDRIIRLRYATVKDTTIMFKAEIRLTAVCDSVTTASDVTVDDCVAVVTYEDDNTELAIHPTETWLDGEHTLHLLWAIHATAGALAYFDVFMVCNGGTLTMDAGDISAYLEGFGLVGDTAWDGLLEIEDTFGAIAMPSITVGNYTDTINADTDTPNGDSISDTFSVISLGTITINGYTDAVVTQEDSE